MNATNGSHDRETYVLAKQFRTPPPPTVSVMLTAYHTAGLSYPEVNSCNKRDPTTYGLALARKT